MIKTELCYESIYQQLNNISFKCATFFYMYDHPRNPKE